VIYFIKRPDDDRIKIGTTARLARRLKELTKSCDTDLIVLGIMDGIFAQERDIHLRFAHLKGAGEWFEPEDDLLDFITKEAREWDGTDRQEGPVLLRPRDNGPKSNRTLRIRLFDWEREAIDRAAALEGLPTATWAREILNSAAGWPSEISEEGR
jgi:predicted DNA binding CopG/RHH family protein